RAFSRAVMPLAWAWRSWASKSACSCVICGGREGAATEGPGCGAALASEAVATDAPTPRVEAPSARAAAPANCFLEVLDTLRCLPMERVMRFRINPFVRERKLNAPGESPVNAAFSWLRSAGNAARGVAAGERVPGSAATASQRFRVPAPFAPGI